MATLGAAGAAILLAWFAGPAGPAGAATAAAPPAPVPVEFPASDSVTLHGRWYPVKAKAPSLVLAPRHRGADPELEAVAAEFQKRGFATLVFELRDPAVASREADSLRYVVFAGDWVNDMVGALRFARGHEPGTGHVFAWGSGLGAALAVAATARGHGLCDALAAEDLFPTIDYEMRRNGTAVIPDAVESQRRHTNWLDEPFSAASRLNLPVYAVLVGPGAGTPGDPVQTALRRNRGRTDRWLRPGVGSPAPLPGPAQVDTLGTWFRRWVAFPPAQ